ncbi:MAG: AAA family ATPase [Dehalococcoidia bacterium]
MSGDTQRLLASLERPLPEPVLYPVLVAVSGLPGTGKSFLSQRLAELMPLAVLESDALRKGLVPSPLYTAGESARLFRAVYELVDLLLKQRVPVLLDATNLLAVHRERLYEIAERHGAKVILVRTKAPPEVVHRRLKERAGNPMRLDRSDADWEIYLKMRASQEHIRHDHVVIDTSRDIGTGVEEILREAQRWMCRGQ